MKTAVVVVVHMLALVLGERAGPVPGMRTAVTARRDAPILFPTDVRPSVGHLNPVDTRRPAIASVPTDAQPVLELPDDLNDLDLVDLRQLNELSNVTEFLEMFGLDIPEEEVETEFGLSTRFGDSGSQTDQVEMATMANCKPELRTVELDLPTEPNTIFFPTCVRLDQCGGCCYGPLLTCRPTVTKLVKLKVVKSSVSTASTSATSGGSRNRGRRRRRQNSVNYHEVEVYKHTQCTCACKVTSSDCNLQIHNYNEGECACVCKNREEKAKCEVQNSTKYWDSESCTCYCRKARDCSSGQYFSHDTCSCEQLSSSDIFSRFGGSSGSGPREISA